MEQFHGVLRPFLASLLMATVVKETGMALPADFGPILRLLVLIPLGAVVYSVAIVLLDREVVKNFLEFARTAFERQGNQDANPIESRRP